MKKYVDVNKEMLLEELNPDTLEDVAESEELSKTLEETNAADALVKKAYERLDCGHAVFRQRCLPIYIIGILVFFAGGLFFVIYAFPDGLVGLIAIAVAIAISIFCGITCTKLFDVYYFTQNKKRYLFYINRKKIAFYKNRKTIVCVNRKTNERIKFDSNYTSFMNVKMGFHRMIGEMKVKRYASGKVKLKTTQYGYDKLNSANADILGESVLILNADGSPKRITVGEHYEYVFDKNESFSLTVPKELVTAVKEKGIDFDFNDSRITVV